MGHPIVWLLLLATQCLSFSIDKKLAGSGCVDLLCPDTALTFGLQNLVNDDTLKTDACTTCSQCTENGYSICLRIRDSRASRTVAGSCSCAHQLATNCHNNLSETVHPANISMRLYSACYTDALQRPPQPLAINENSSVILSIEPFWLEPYWRQLKVDNLTLHYSFIVKSPEHCEANLETSPRGVHTCSKSVEIDMADTSKEISQDKEDDYEHSENYDQYDDELPPEVQFDRDYFAGAKTFDSYYTVVVSRPRQLKMNAVKADQVYNRQTVIQSEQLKFDLKPEIYGVSGRVEHSEEDQVPESEEEAEVEKESSTTTTVSTEGVTVVREDSDETAVSEEMGGTNFFEESKSDKKVEKDSEESDEDDDTVKVNLADVEPKKLKPQEESESEEEEKEGSEGSEEKEGNKTTITTTTTEKSENGTTTVGESEEGSEESEETTTVELVEAETNEDEESSEKEEGEEGEEEGDENETFLSRITNSFDFPRVRLVFLITLASFIAFILIVLCLFYRDKYCCCKSKSSKTSNGYRYTTANQPTELKPVSRANSAGVHSTDLQNQPLLDEAEILDNFRSIIRSGTTFNPNKVELGISVGMGRFGPIYRAMFNSYNGSVHDVNVYLLKNVTRLPDNQLSNLSTLLKSNISAGNHPNVVSLCGISQAGPDVMLMWEPLHQPTLQGVLRESRCARFGSEPFNFASFLSSERLATMAIGCCSGVEHLLKKNVYPAHLSTSNILVAERGIVKISGFGLAEHHALNMSSENAPTRFRWMPPEYFQKLNDKIMLNEQTIIWSLGVVLWEIFSLGGTPFSSYRQVQSFIDSMRDGSAKLDPITYCGEAVSQLLSTCTSHSSEARGDIRTIIKRLECISADAKAQINLCYSEDFPYVPIVTQLEQQTE